MTDYLPWTIDHMAAEEMQQDWNDLRFQRVFHDAYKEGAEYVKHYADKKIEALAAELAALKEQMRWRDVRVELPEESGRYLCFRPSAAIDEIATRSFYYDHFSGASEVTHWMPLPSHPTTTSNED